MSWSHQLTLLAVAFGLSSIMGLERELRQKTAGLRTHTLVGVGAAVFKLVSKYGFTDVVTPGTVSLDPSRVAAQVVSGIGFIGAGHGYVISDLDVTRDDHDDSVVGVRFDVEGRRSIDELVESLQGLDNVLEVRIGDSVD